MADDSGFEVRDATLPEGVIKDDPEFGPVPVIYELAEIPVRFYRPAGAARSVALEASFQGCRDGEICDPPQLRVVEVKLPATSDAIPRPVSAPGRIPAAEPAAAAAPRSEQYRLASLLLENPRRAIFAFFIAGILLAFTPCVFPMVPILSGIIAGQGSNITTLRAFWLSLTYVLAMAVAARTGA